MQSFVNLCVETLYSYVTNPVDISPSQHYPCQCSMQGGMDMEPSEEILNMPEDHDVGFNKIDEELSYFSLIRNRITFSY